MQHSSSKRGHLKISSFIREEGSLSPTIFSSLGHMKIVNCWRDVRWSILVHSKVRKLENSNSVREVREGGNNAKLSLGKDSRPSHGLRMQRLVSMSIEVRDGFFSNFSQFSIRSNLKLGSIPPSENVSTSGQLYMVRYCNIGRRVFI